MTYGVLETARRLDLDALEVIEMLRDGRLEPVRVEDGVEVGAESVVRYERSQTNG
ncbi:MAG: hypothetical protein ACOYNI_08055 [Acidimicrobiia bacterium]